MPPIPARPNTAIPSASWCTLTSANPSLLVSALFDATAPVITSGYGGWVEIARPKRKALTDWQGSAPFRLQFGLILDAFDDAPHNVEQDIIRLERMATRGPHDQRPPTIRINDKDHGGGGRLPHNNLTWVIESLTWGDCIRQSETGDRTRQVVAVTLLELVEDAIIGKLSPANNARNISKIRGGQALSTRIIVKQGETSLQQVAARALGDAKKWKALAKANNIRDPKKIYTGQQLRIP